MNKQKLSKTVTDFLNYGFKGNGKYYLTEYGSQNFRNTLFSNFLRLNEDCIKIISKGNDAPRGGKVGEYVEVVFNDKFNEKFDSFFTEKKLKEERILLAKQEQEKDYKTVTEKFRIYAQNNPEKVIEWNDKIKEMSNKKARLFMENKVGNSTGNPSFWGKYRIYEAVINKN